MTALALTAAFATAADKKSESQKAVSAKKASSPAPAPGPDAKIRVETKFADREGLFIVHRKGGVAHIEFSNNNGESQRRELHHKDFEFIVKSLKELPRNSNLPPDCSRFAMKITTEGLGLDKDGFLSCFGVKTLTSPAYSRFATILTNAL
jgi:hypothetical protein